MNATLTKLKIPALISLILVLPLILMELINRRSMNEAFPFPLFVILFLLPFGFILILTPIVQKVRAGKKILDTPLSLLISVVMLILIAGLWVGILVDQMPCFLGVLNCD